MQPPDERERSHRATRRSAADLLGLLAGAVLLATLAGYAAGLWWPAELASHFRVQYLLCLASVAPLLRVLRRRRMAVACAIGALLNAVSVSGAVVSGGLAVPSAAAVAAGHVASSYRFLEMNVLTSNTRSDLVIDHVRYQRPDVLVLLEVDERWLKDLSALNEDFPHRVAEPRPDNFGVAVLSRLPLEGGRVVDFSGHGLPSIVTDVRTPSGSLTLVATHAVPPRGGRLSRIRNEHLAHLAAYARAHDGPLLVLGDLNCTPWSPYFGRLLREGDLQRAGRGVMATWPTSGSTALLRLPLDHGLYRGELAIRAAAVGRDVGSDHLPLRVDVSLR